MTTLFSVSQTPVAPPVAVAPAAPLRKRFSVATPPPALLTEPEPDYYPAGPSGNPPPHVVSRDAVAARRRVVRDAEIPVASPRFQL